MAEVRISAERSIPVAPARVYSLIADYRQHHPHILPPAFADLRVLEGGVGAGTTISFKLTLGGLTQAGQAVVTEPEPGRRLVESDLAGRYDTSFTVSPEGSGSRVRIETVLRASAGIRGFFERLLSPRLLRKLYEDELTRLDRYAREQR